MAQEGLHLRLVSGHGDGLQPHSPFDPIAVLEADHCLKMDLCDALEGLADGLPHEADTALASIAINVLRDGLPDHIALEERHLFPLLRAHLQSDGSLSPVLVQLQREHDHDEACAYEIAEELERFVRNGSARNAEMLGYMLRGFFVSLRRHVHWENATVLPLARRTLGEADLAELRQAIRARSRRHALRGSVELFIPDTNAPPRS